MLCTTNLSIVKILYLNTIPTMPNSIYNTHLVNPCYCSINIFLSPYKLLGFIHQPFHPTPPAPITPPSPLTLPTPATPPNPAPS